MGTTKQHVKTEGESSAPRHSEAFKRDAVGLVTEECYNFAAAAIDGAIRIVPGRITKY